jgi:hypothetical protein
MTTLKQTLADQALNLLLLNLRDGNFTYNETIGKHVIARNATWTYIMPCSTVTMVQESTSTLLAATALAKAGHVTLGMGVSPGALLGAA